MTLRRLTTGIALVGSVGKTPVATGTLYLGTSNASAPATYRRADCAFIGQLAVAPELQRRGVGRHVCGLLEKRARESGRAFCALDTAESAGELLRWYERLGYREIDSVRWPGKVYRSLVLIKSLHERNDVEGGKHNA